MQLVDKQEGTVGDAVKLMETYPNKVAGAFWTAAAEMMQGGGCD